MQRNYNLKKTISIKKFIAEFGGTFSEAIKTRLSDLEIRSVLTRKAYTNVLDIKHVEHTQYPCTDEDTLDCGTKEYSFGEFLVIDNVLYYSNNCLEGPTVTKSPVSDLIYNNLGDENIINFEGIEGKQITDANIDYVIDTLLEYCSDVSQKYKDTIAEINKCAATKLNRISFNN
ncbi:hypothetical protein SDC9_149081 [bioreactor metagenome]|uniref:Uncharacterized protein n=1 Tax=bioreactor metagenome TaxID=1076179 RepID=A0A645EL68_9ZZZZ